MTTLRDYQADAIKSIFAHWSTGSRDHGLIVVPTGGGKSLIIAALCENVQSIAPGTRILMLTHVRELLSQNEDELLKYYPDAPVGIFSAGMNRKEIDAPILFAGIQSIDKHAHKISPAPEIVIIDEAHLIPEDEGTRYNKTLKLLEVMNPKVKIIGLTATPFRLGSGWLHVGDNAIFSKIIYDIPVQRLIDAGHLCHVTTKAGVVKIDTSKVHHSCGDFNTGEMEAIAMAGDMTSQAVKQMVTVGIDRKKWLAFAISIAHAGQIKEELKKHGISAEVITSNTPKKERDEIVDTFKNGGLYDIRCLVGVGIFTTGFNAPAVDMIAMLRPTESAGLYVQCIGRGLRNAPGKGNCLVLDFAGNTIRHGPIDDINPTRKRGDGEGIAPCKECPECGSIVAAGFRECPDCGYIFPPPERIVHAVPIEAPILKSQVEPVEPVEREVMETIYSVHQKKGKSDSVRIDYRIGNLSMISEWIFPEAGSDAGCFFYNRWCIDAGIWPPFPKNAAEFVEFEPNWIQAAKIWTKPDGNYTRVIKHEWKTSGLVVEKHAKQVIYDELDECPF